MPLFDAIFQFLHEIISFFWFTLVGPSIKDPPEEKPVARREAPASAATPEKPLSFLAHSALETTPVERHVVSITNEGSGRGSVEANVSDSFLTQLEQRTQQVKITLANLEAERARIEEQIAKLQPIIPHYEALMSAERGIEEAGIAFEAPAPRAASAPAAQGSNWTAYNP